MFMGPFENTISWSQDGLVGARRFLERVNGLSDHIKTNEVKYVTASLHKTIKKVSEDIEAFKFNTAVSAMMIFVNAAEKDGLLKSSYETFLKLLAPFAPHLTEELWTELGYKESIHLAAFPVTDDNLARDEQVTIGVQINGKLRGSITLSPQAEENEVMDLVGKDSELSKKFTPDQVIKVVYIPGRILNLIIKDV
jgi:leucyl-tRNA synthetase